MRIVLISFSLQMYSLVEGRIVKCFDLWKFLGDTLQFDLQDLPRIIHKRRLLLDMLH